MTEIPLSLESIILNIKDLIKKLQPYNSTAAKNNYLVHLKEVADFFKLNPQSSQFLKPLDDLLKYFFYILIFLKQEKILSHLLQEDALHLQEFLQKLKAVEEFYQDQEGLIGYYLSMIELMLDKDKEHKEHLYISYLKPTGYDISNDGDDVKEAVFAAIEAMPQMVEIYPVGGAGDRLNLKDSITFEDLPAAELELNGKTLLEGLIRDLEAREYLYYKTFQKQVKTPIVLMTSKEKNNSFHIKNILEKNNWFGRDLSLFYFIEQPLVPMLTEEGLFAFSSDHKPLFKPGGHGVLWKLLEEADIFEKLFKLGKTKALIRQINNPLSGIDYGLLAFVGKGIQGNKKFGFASCPRLLHTAEGMNVLKKEIHPSLYSYNISNIEYTDFVKRSIQDEPEFEGSPYSAFPANTNILFVDLQEVQQAVKKMPIPGKLINMKTCHVCLGNDGELKEVKVGRLESLMQNIVDVIVDSFKKSEEKPSPEVLSTYLTYNKRNKTISVAKKMHTKGSPLVETTEGSYLDLQLAARDLFLDLGFSLPEIYSQEEFLKKGPSCIIHYHPALGPLYSVIQKKIRHGALEKGAELNLEIAEVDIENLYLKGTLNVIAENITGYKNEHGDHIYSHKVGKCILKNVKVLNQGISHSDQNIFWKKGYNHNEMLTIILKGHSNFIAENVEFNGSYHFEVPDGYTMHVTKKHELIESKLLPLKEI